MMCFLLQDNKKERKEDEAMEWHAPEVSSHHQDSKDFIAHLKHHIKNGNCSSVTQ